MKGRKPGQSRKTANVKTTAPKPDANGSFRFAEGRGKTVEFVEFYTAAGFHIVEIRFDDRTALHFTIDPAFKIEPGYSRWKEGNERVLKRWPPIHCE